MHVGKVCSVGSWPWECRADGEGWEGDDLQWRKQRNEALYVDVCAHQGPIQDLDWGTLAGVELQICVDYS